MSLRLYKLAYLIAAAAFAQDTGRVTLIPSADDSATGELRFREKRANGTNYVGFKAPDIIGGNIIWTLPGSDGTAGDCLVTDGAGVFSFSTCGGGSSYLSRGVGADYARLYPTTATDSLHIGTTADYGAYKPTLVVFSDAFPGGQQRTKVIFRAGADQGFDGIVDHMTPAGVIVSGIDALGTFYTSNASSEQGSGLSNSGLTLNMNAKNCWTGTVQRYDAVDVCFERTGSGVVSLTDGFGALERLEMDTTYTSRIIGGAFGTIYTATTGGFTTGTVVPKTDLTYNLGDPALRYTEAHIRDVYMTNCFGPACPGAGLWTDDTMGTTYLTDLMANVAIGANVAAHKLHVVDGVIGVTGTGAGINVDTTGTPTGFVKAPKFEIRDPTSNTIFWDLQAAITPLISSSMYIRDNGGNITMELNRLSSGVATNLGRVDLHWMPYTHNTRDLGSNSVRWKDLYLSGSCFGCPGGMWSGGSGRVYPTTTTDRIHIGDLAAGSTTNKAPLYIWRNPATSAAGEARGLYVNISSNEQPTPAANDIVGVSFRVTNDADNNSGLWGLNVLAQASLAPDPGVHVNHRAIEVELQHPCTSGNFTPLPYGGTGCRANVLELVAHGGNNHQTTSALAILGADTNPNRYHHTGIYLQNIANTGIWFNNSGGGGEYANALILDGTNAGGAWKVEGGTHTNFFDLFGAGFISYFLNVSGPSDVLGDFVHGPAGGTSIDFYRAPIRVYGDAASIHVDTIGTPGYIKAPKFEIRDPFSSIHFWDMQASVTPGIASRLYIRNSAGDEVLRMVHTTGGSTVNDTESLYDFIPVFDNNVSLGSASRRWQNLNLSNTINVGGNLFTDTNRNTFVQNLTIAGSCFGTACAGGSPSKWTDGGAHIYPVGLKRVAIGSSSDPGVYTLGVNGLASASGLYTFNLGAGGFTGHVASADSFFARVLLSNPGTGSNFGDAISVRTAAGTQIMSVNFNGDVFAGNRYYAQGNAGFTGTCGSATTIQVVGGIITNCF